MNKQLCGALYIIDGMKPLKCWLPPEHKREHSWNLSTAQIIAAARGPTLMMKCIENPGDYSMMEMRGNGSIAMQIYSEKIRKTVGEMFSIERRKPDEDKQ